MLAFVTKKNHHIPYATHGKINRLCAKSNFCGYGNSTYSDFWNVIIFSLSLQFFMKYDRQCVIFVIRT